MVMRRNKWVFGMIIILLLSILMPDVALAIETYTVTYDGNGADSGSVPVDGNSYPVGTEVYVLDKGTLARTNYSFVAWNTYADGSGIPYLPPASFSISGNTTLYATWVLNTYTVVFNTQGGRDLPSISDLVYGSTISPPVWDQLNYGYIFSGWYKEEDCINAWDFDNDTVTDNITLYGKWTPSPLYSVSFDKNGGQTEAVPTTKNAVYGFGVDALPTAPARTGWTFAGWNTAADGGGSTFIETTPVTANTTVYAQWTLNDQSSGGGGGHNTPSKPDTYRHVIGSQKPVVQIQQELEQAGVRDVKPTDWFAGPVSVVIQAGLVQPDADGNFHPEAKVSTGEGIAVLAKVLGVAAKNDSIQQAVAKMQDAGLVNTQTSTEQGMSRSDFAKIITLALGVEPPAVTRPEDYPFADFDKASAEERGIFKALYDLGIIIGYFDDGVRTFRPDNILTRAELAILIDRLVSA